MEYYSRLNSEAGEPGHSLAIYEVLSEQTGNNGGVSGVLDSETAINPVTT
jgi:hypothetical protein